MTSSLGTPDFGATELDTACSVRSPPASVRPEPPIFPDTTASPAPASPPSKGQGTGGKRHRKQPGGRPGRVKRYGRLGASLAVLAAVLGIGFNTDFGSENTARPRVQRV